MSENKSVYCGIGPVPKNQKRGSMLECSMNNQVRFWGLHSVDKKTLEQARLKSTTKAYFNRLKTSVTNLKYDILAMKKKYKKMSNKTEKDALMKTMEKKNELFKTKRRELMDLEVAMGKTIVFKKKKPRESTPKPTPTKEPKEPEPVPTPTATTKATTKATKKKEQPKKEDQIIKELREYIVKHNPNFSEQDLDEAVEEILEKGYIKKYEEEKNVGDAIYEALMSTGSTYSFTDDEGDEEDEPKMLSMPGSLIKDMLPDKEGNIMSYKDFYKKFKLHNEGMTNSQLLKKSKEIYDSLVKGVKKSKVTKKKEPKKEQPKKEQPKKEPAKKEDKIITELRDYIKKNNIDATVEEILEKGYLKEYEKYNFVGEAVWEAMKHPCLKIGNNEIMFTHPNIPRLKYYMDKDNYKGLKSKLKTIQQEINGAVFVLGLHPKECHDLPARQQLFEDYQLLFSDEVKQLWKAIYKKLVIPKIKKEPKDTTTSTKKKEPKATTKATKKKEEPNKKYESAPFEKWYNVWTLNSFIVDAMIKDKYKPKVERVVDTKEMKHFLNWADRKCNENYRKFGDCTLQADWFFPMIYKKVINKYYKNDEFDDKYIMTILATNYFLMEMNTKYDYIPFISLYQDSSHIFTRSFKADEASMLQSIFDVRKIERYEKGVLEATNEHKNKYHLRPRVKEISTVEYMENPNLTERELINYKAIRTHDKKLLDELISLKKQGEYIDKNGKFKLQAQLDKLKKKLNLNPYIIKKK